MSVDYPQLKFYTYEFDELEAVFHNFHDLLAQVDRVPGISGGIDRWGNDQAPGQIGRVTASFWLTAANLKARSRAAWLTRCVPLRTCS